MDTALAGTKDRTEEGFIFEIDGRRVGIVDMDTGEILDPNVLHITKQVPASGSGYWWRFMMSDLVQLINEDMPGAQMHAVGTILDNISPYDNSIAASMTELAEQAGVSEKTMRMAMMAMRKHDMIRKVRAGYYKVSPRFLTQGGGAHKYTTLALSYQAINDNPGQKKK